MTTLLTLYTGQKPKDPLVLPVTKTSDGSAVDLTLYDAVSVIIRNTDGDIVSGTGSSTAVVSTNQAVYTWGTTSVFADPGDYSVTVKMTKSGGTKDYASIGTISVERSLEDTALTATPFVTADEVYDTVGITVDFRDILKAQTVIEAATGLNIRGAYDPGSTFFDIFKGNDVNHLINAIIWQTKYLQERPEALSEAGNIASASVNGVSVSYAQNGADGFLSPLAAKCLARLSWRRKKARTLMPTAARNAQLRSQDLVNDEGYQIWRPL